jgi:hypothetical protein
MKQYRFLITADNGEQCRHRSSDYNVAAGHHVRYCLKSRDAFSWRATGCLGNGFFQGYRLAPSSAFGFVTYKTRFHVTLA